MKKVFKEKGFTLIELIITVAIIAILATFAYMSFSSYTNDAENVKKENQIDLIKNDIEYKNLKEESFPSSLQ